MSPMVSRNETSYVVDRPRASDAIGDALRGVYAREPLPEDMATLLRRLSHDDCLRSRN